MFTNQTKRCLKNILDIFDCIIIRFW